MILSCQDISVTLGKKELLKGVSFDISKPQLIGLLGPNGAGKSTLMRSLVSLIDFEGQVSIGFSGTTELSSQQIAREIAFLPQDRKVHWDVTCRDVVAIGRIPHLPRFGKLSAEDLRAVDDAMEQMGVGGFADRSFDHLSGGEQARVLIARTLAQQTNIIVADEPASGLDPAYQIEMMRLFQQLVAEGRTILVSLHDLPLASAWCDRILLMQNGQLVADGPPQTSMDEATMARVFGITVTSIQEGHMVVPVGVSRDHQAPEAGG